jgi:NAD(P)-dependent dehydrogenase (short-subunit alcohol dehydrogenase family)
MDGQTNETRAGLSLPVDADLSERVALVTGANAGMGKATAQEFARMGAEVILACRDRGRGESAAAEIVTATGNNRVTVVGLDLASLSSVRACVSDITQRFPRLDVLVNNAAASLPRREITPDGFERHWATNVLGPYLLTTLLLPHLERSDDGRIVTVSTVAAGGLDLDDPAYERRRFGGLGAYRASKQAARMLTWSLAERLAGTAVTANALNPGYVASDLSRNAGTLMRAVVALTGRWAQAPLDGADTAIWLAASPDVRGTTGKFWSKRREIACRYRDPGPIAELVSLVERQVAGDYVGPPLPGQ